MTIKFTLTPSSSLNVDNFTIKYAVSGGALTQKATGVTRAQLAAGYTISDFPEGTTGGTINSTGICTSYYVWTFTAPAACVYHTVTVDPTDTDMATGNVNSMNNGVVVVEYTDCAGNPAIFRTSFSGDQFCGRETTTTIKIYQNDMSMAASGSYVTKTTTPCTSFD